MDVWIRWLGELFWRITKVAPSKEHLKSDPKNEEFWFRAYGIIMLVVGLWMGLRIGGAQSGFLAGLASVATNYPGADKSFAQPYVGAVLVLIVGVGAAVVSVAVTTFVISLIIRVVTWGLLRWSQRYQERHPEESRKHLAVFLGIAAGLIVAALVIAAPNLKFPPPSTSTPPDRPKNETPPAA